MEPLIDAAGQCHRQASGPVRVVSLVPSLTELLFELGVGDSIVGRTAYCVHPRERVKAVTRVGGTKTIHFDRIDALDPTHILVNIDETPRHVATELSARGYSLIVTHPRTLNDNLSLFRLLGGVFAREAAAVRLAEQFIAARDALAASVHHLPSRRVLYLIWKEPWMTVGRETYVSSMLATIGWRTWPEVAEPRYPAVSIGPELLSAVDLVLFASEPFPFRARHIEAFQKTFPEHATKAMAVDGQMVSWYGSRAIQAMGYLQALAADSAMRMATRTK
ncbi:MAG: helical backbone metal receptor [Rhodospirillales bacterium]|nr:helical backbone metal receptor [Rhodospirillales bacterium]